MTRDIDDNDTPPADYIVGEGDLPLIGEVKTVFTVDKEENIAPGLEQARLEQEQMTGYPLKLAGHSFTRTVDGLGEIYEVLAVYAPAQEGEAA